jgi:hypothetical protein
MDHTASLQPAIIPSTGVARHQAFGDELTVLLGGEQTGGKLMCGILMIPPGGGPPTLRAESPRLIGTALYGALRRVVWDRGANHSPGPDSPLVSRWYLVAFNDFARGNCQHGFVEVLFGTLRSPLGDQIKGLQSRKLLGNR